MPIDKTKKNIFLLATCQALFMTSTSAVFTTSALVGHMLAEDKSFSTLPLAMQFAAGMAVTVPASLYMKRVGRRIGFMTGTVIGMTGAVTATYAIFAHSLVLFCLGSALLGCFNGFSRYFRFAAADASDQEFRSRAVSLVLAGGVVAGFTGPNLARLTLNLFEPIVFAGIFASLLAVHVTILGVLLFVDIPRPGAEEREHSGRPLWQIARQPICIVAILGAAVSYVVMSFLMTVTPLAMTGHHFEFADAAFVVQGHLLGMFVPAFFTGHLIARFGVLNVMLCGAALMLACVVINLSGTTFPHFVTALVLVGVGWNFLFVGATMLLTESCTPAEKAKTQALNEFIVFGMVAAGALTSGVVHHVLGWAAVNLAVAPLIVIVFAAILWFRLLSRKEIVRVP
jgi:MFS family permease